MTEPVGRRQCEEYRDQLLDLARIHVEIDARGRMVDENEPDWILRLRKVCLHAVAATACEVDADGVHAMTTELRAAYEQMHAVWKRLPDESRMDEDEGWWANEARNGLATYNHPTTVRLVLSLASGGFGDAEAPGSYLQVAIWLGRLGCGYALALSHLAQVLNTGLDVDGIRSRLVAILADLQPRPEN